MEDDFDNWLAEREQDQDIPADSGDVLQPGQRIGAYRILRQLGVGGMGQVYEAEHVALGVKRALKVFSTASEHSEFLRKRFVAEGRILADLQHPRIVRVYDLVVDEDSDTAYFEMDLVLSPNGQPCTLADRLQEGVYEEEIVGWFKDICEGLAYIHSQGVVHRDISLDNILIGRDGRAVITDFGIAKIIDDSYRRKIAVTATMVYKDGAEVRMGKERYMAPELKKPGGKVSFASDAWAVGISLFKMLSGSWYDVGTHLEDWLADFEYDWHPIIAQLCNADPVKRLGEGGIAALPMLLKRKSRPVPFWRRKWVLGGGLIISLVVAVLGTVWFPRKMDVTPQAKCAECTKDLEYKFETDKSTGEKTVAIVKVRGAKGDFVIPTEIEGCRVARIADGAFMFCNALLSVTIPTSVTSIDASAFSFCSGLTIVTIPNGVANIGKEAFCCCHSLDKVTIPASVTNIGERAFSRCPKLEEFLVAEDNPNYKSTSGILLTKDGKTLVAVPSKLRHRTISDAVTCIGNYAFDGCSSLTSVTIPANVTNIGEKAFVGCAGLKEILVVKGNSSYKSVSGFLLTKDGKTLVAVPSKLRHITIPNGVTCIGNYAFGEYCNLTEVTIPASVTEIGEKTFVNCRELNSFSVVEGNPRYKSVSGLLLTKDGKTLIAVPHRIKDVSIPDGVMCIGDRTFGQYENLTSVMIPSSVTNIGKEAFFICKRLNEFSVAEGNPKYKSVSGILLTKDGKTLVAIPPSLEEVKIPDGVTCIGNNAFEFDNNLTSVTIPASVTEIGERAFVKCRELNSFSVAEGNPKYKSVSGLLLTEDGKTLVAVPSHIKNVSIPDGVTRVQRYAFSGSDGSIFNTTSIPYVNLLDGWAVGYKKPLSGDLVLTGVHGVGDYAFAGCSKLTSVTFPDSVTSIGAHAFLRCNGLTHVTIPTNVISIGFHAFDGCSNLVEISVDAGNKRYYARDGLLLTKDGKTLVTIAGSRKNVMVPEGITHIDEGMFGHCSNLTRVTIPSSVTSIGQSAFDGDIQSFEYCFEGVEKNSIVAISTIGCRLEKTNFLRGYKEMIDKLNPSCIICLGKPFDEMTGNLIVVDYIESRRVDRYGR